MKFIKKKDFIIIAVILLIACVFYYIYNFGSRSKAVKAEIYYRSELAMTVNLDKNENRVFELPQNKNVMFHLYEDGSICFEKSDCPDKICIDSGKLKIAGASAACLPNEVIMKIVPVSPNEKTDVDLIVK